MEVSNNIQQLVSIDYAYNNNMLHFLMPYDYGKFPHVKSYVGHLSYKSFT